jgi:HSP20 family protein
LAVIYIECQINENGGKYMNTNFYDLLLNDFGFKVPVRNARSFNIDVIEGEGFYKVYAEMPGVNKKDITIDFEDGILKISANKEEKKEKYLLREISRLPFYREVNFGNVDEESIKAKYTDGILEVTVVLKKPEEKTKKSITIE